MVRLLLLSVLSGLSLGNTYAQDWTRLNPDREPLNLYDVYIDPAGFGWVGGEKGTLLHTTDFGQSWTDQSDIQFGTILHLDYVQGSNGQQVVVAGSKISATQDGGQSWTTWIPATNVGAYQGVAAPSAQAIYVTSNQGKLLKSQDGGVSFAEVTTLPFEEEWTDIEFLDDSLGWLGSREGDLLRTTDGAQSWTVLHDGTFESRLEFTWLDAQTGYLVHDRDFLRTTDGGVSWDTLAENVLNIASDDLAAIDSAHIVVTQGARMAQSSDGGLTWTRDHNHPYIGTDNRAVHAHADGKVWAANSWHSLLYSTDAGLSWSDLFPGFRGFLRVVDSWRSDTVIALGNNGMMVKSTNGGLDWQEMMTYTPDTMSARGIVMYSAYHYVIPGLRAFFSTRDGGLTWSQDTLIGNGLAWSVGCKPNGEIYVPHMSNGLYRSRDSGQTWTLEPTPSSTLRNISWGNDSLGILTGDQGQMYRTTDGGQSWDSVATGTRESLATSYWKSDSEVIVLERSAWDSLLSSHDAGVTWEKQKLPQRTSYHRIAFADSLQGWIVGGSGSSGYLFETTDGGQSWAQVMSHTGVYFGLALDQTNSLRAWAVGQGGMIRFLGRLDSSLQDTTTTALTGAQPDSDWQLYPNPSQGWVSLQTPEASTLPLSLEVYSLQGQRLKIHTWQQVPDRIDLRDLPDGWYLLRLQQGDRWAFRKLRLN